MRSLLTAITAHDEATDYLTWPGDFELDRNDHVEPVHLASGATLEGFAGDGTGGTYFFCGDGGEERPVLYADSEGGAALIAIGLEELLQLLLVTPWWRDFDDFTAEECRKLEAEYLEDIPELFALRDRAAAALDITLPTEAEVLTRLRHTATVTGQDFVLIFTPEGNPYDNLFNRWGA
ncbi:hypothetical protein JIG36_33960 [Actinoplanes sp. LDG1-06]|uniref:SUKH-4 immunity protein of toxin-antitoxin system n=1 Tax=Paractinoplanes ovalisporus TaxID=2810368 RepID=A0ABS2AL04_9ACTN|nr:hypothetical protein [Actinoplanes ovalisporus]MBM2620518.1 hypothetical protein [Actinoplanes ovalisporus]